MFFTFKQLLL